MQRKGKIMKIFESEIYAKNCRGCLPFKIVVEETFEQGKRKVEVRKIEYNTVGEKMLEIYNSRKEVTNLKFYRLKAGISQKELAKYSNVPLRTIQQYEQRQKNINAASVETIIKLAKVLFCSVEDLVEVSIE